MSQITVQCTRLSGNGMKYMTLCIKTNMTIRDIRFVLSKRCKRHEENLTMYLDEHRKLPVDLNKYYMNYNAFNAVYFDESSTEKDGVFQRVYKFFTCCVKRSQYYDYSPLV